MTPAPAAAGRLLICPTPIGNLQDVTLRVLSAIAEADVVACEDTRRTQRLLRRHGLTAALVSFHEHNERARARELVARIRAGATVALVCDAGTPIVSDPGFALVRTCIDAGLQVEALPGPSAVLAALVASGLPAERWRFAGFLPRRPAALEELLSDSQETLVAFESPRRLAGTLRLLAEGEPRRAVAVCRELSKLHEEVRRGTAEQLAAEFTEHPARGEITLVIGAASPGRRPGGGEQARQAVRDLIAAGARARPAAAVVARLTGLATNELYREATRPGQ